ncbi:acetylornithine deacetylase [Algicola sagamiensis]|uniref:acetylornithine deacetylase n=1 Tax=Algicola sagamiensis TaxID=163869 RepID=UPI000371BAC7|nr:acetylornithine deacetylase [Algicola sagamiensis]
MTTPTFLELYRQLIAFPSISALDEAWDQSNESVITYLANIFESMGFHCEVMLVCKTRKKYNLLASLGTGPGGLLLSGHTDTVPFDEGRWQSDPFQLLEKDNRFYGLGTIDMKGFFAFIIDVLREFECDKFSKPLHILATADEEITMAGAMHATKHLSIQPEVAIIGEPTGLQPIVMHKGHMAEGIRITGKSGHSSDPSKGLNAIDVMMDVLGRLKDMRQSMIERYQHDAFEVPYPTMNFGHIHGGDGANRICGCCELHLDMRPIPGLSVESLWALLHEQLHPLQQQYPDAIELFHLHDPLPPFQGEPDGQFAQYMEALSGQSSTAVNYCTEAPFIQQLGCETIVLGPGHITQAHQPNEFLDHQMIEPTKHLLRSLIRDVCL